MDSDNNWLPFEIIHMFMWMSSGLIHGRNIATVSHKLRIIRSRSSGALMVEVWICTNMALQNLQQYGCQTGNKLKEKSRDLNGTLDEMKMKQCSVGDTKTLWSLKF